MKRLTCVVVCLHIAISLCLAQALPSRTTRNQQIQATRLHFQGDYEGAAALLEECVSKIDRECGPFSEHSGRALLSLGWSQMMSDKASAAERSFKRSLHIAEKRDGKDSGSCVGALRALGMLYEKQRKWQEAAKAYDRCVNSLYETDIHSLPTLAEILERYADVLRKIPAKESWFGVAEGRKRPRAEMLEKRAKHIRKKIKAQRSTR